MDSDTRSARLIIADDHALLRSGIRSMLYGEPGLEVVGEAANGMEALCLRPRSRAAGGGAGAYDPGRAWPVPDRDAGKGSRLY